MTMVRAVAVVLALAAGAGGAEAQNVEAQALLDELSSDVPRWMDRLNEELAEQGERALTHHAEMAGLGEACTGDSGWDAVDRRVGEMAGWRHPSSSPGLDPGPERKAYRIKLRSRAITAYLEGRAERCAFPLNLLWRGQLADSNENLRLMMREPFPQR